MEYTRQDTLKGSITTERAWWDLTYYHLDVSVDIDKKIIRGKNTIQYQILKKGQAMQIDLQLPMKIDSVKQLGELLTVGHEVNTHFVKLKADQSIGSIMELEVYFSGHPIEAANPPWDGGIAWKNDEKGNPFIASACQGIGASSWWPCKDHSYDEPDSVLISVTMPKELINVSNGRLRSIESNSDGTRTHNWFVSNPISSYGININIGNYVNFTEQYEGEGGVLDMDYYVLKHNLKKAQKQFEQAKLTIEAFEYWFGKYPFYEDSYKLVETPYLGMEHQSSVTYGNGYQNGYSGRDLSDSGWGLKFDFIIVHESGHEWFANNITHKDVADMWIHESFTAYSENLYLDYHFGKNASEEYVIGTRKNIENVSPIIGDYGVNYQNNSRDMYYKGANMLHTLRQLVNDDDKWRQALRGLNKEFYHQIVTTDQVENYLSLKLEMDLGSFFDQYLRDRRMPTLEYYVKNGGLFTRWTNCIMDFSMPVKIYLNDLPILINPTTEWKQASEVKKGSSKIRIDKNFYVGAINITGD